MPNASRPVIAGIEERPREGWDDPVHGTVSWHTLISGDITPTDSLSGGMAELKPGGRLNPHRHTHPEIYHIVAGTGVLTIEGREETVTAGSSVFIPGDAEHGIRNEAGSDLTFLYVFPADTSSEVVYRFPEASPPA